MATSDLTVVYLGGFGRSGTTMLERILGGIDGWANAGEVVDLSRTVGTEDELCGCGEPFSRCPVWTAVGEQAFGGWTPEVFERLARLKGAVSRQRHLPRLLAAYRRGGPEQSGPLDEMRTTWARVYRAFADVTGSHVVVDASKGPAFGLALAGAPGLDLRMLNLVRDPRGVAWSWQKQVSRPQATGQNTEMWRIPARRSALQWAGLQTEMEVIARAGLPTARLRYEDLVADPGPATLAALDSLGLPLGPADLPHVDGRTVTLGPSHGLSGNPGRFRHGAHTLVPDATWQTGMPTSTQALTSALTLPLLAAYRYPVRPGRTAAGSDQHTDHNTGRS